MRKSLKFSTLWRALFVAPMVLAFSACATHAPQVRAVYDLIERVTPGYGDQFRLELMATGDSVDVYEVGSKRGKVLLRGNNPVALATAYNQYLKYDCNAHVSWLGDQLDLPARLPLPASTRRDTIRGRYRVYMNYCTVSYAAAWWNWERWQREIDYMAMNSVNMPLSVVGLEAVWYNTLVKHGFTDGEARGFLAGPAHAAWQWMQNLQSYGGPLSKSWIDRHAELGKKIIDRELELGMQPIQQGFSGYVPRDLKAKYPRASIRTQPSWCGFRGVAQLDPTDTLFQVIGRDFLEEQKRLYGAHGVYAADPFHESAPPINTPEYLTSVGQSIHRLFRNFDPDAVWAMQAWSLREPIVKAVPKSDLLILDLDGSKCNASNDYCWGYPVVAGNLHNFGGRINLHGDLPLLASNQYARAVRRAPNVCGSGLFMEAIGQNPVYYDLAFEMPLHADSIDVVDWLGHYARRRYGAPSESAFEAWQILLRTAYSRGTNGTENSSIIAARPALDVKKSGPNAGFAIPYDPVELLRAEELLLQDADKLGESSPYRFDIVDVQRQVMSNLGQRIHRQAAEAFKRGEKAAFRRHGSRFLDLLRDVDVLLRTRPEFNFDRWLAEARSWGQTPEEKDQYERDATALFTIWGGDGDPLIFDYGWKEWAGLIEGYYLPRWEKFYAMLESHLDSGTPYVEKGLRQTHGREAFRANAFYDNLADWELNYVATCGKVRIPITSGDEIETARRMFLKYKALSQEYADTAENTGRQPSGERYENLGQPES